MYLESWYIVIDVNGVEIELNHIVKYENTATNKLRYYIADTSDFGYLWLFLYDSKGRIDKNGLDNIRIDEGISLLNDENGRWTILGTKEEVYNMIFNN